MIPVSSAQGQPARRPPTLRHLQRVVSRPVPVFPPRSTLQSVRVSNVAAAAVGLLICTGGPSTYIALHHMGPGSGWRTWVFMYPFAAVAIFGIAALLRTLSETQRPWWQRLPWPMYSVALYVGWALLSATWSVTPDITSTTALIGVGIAAFGCWVGCGLRSAEQIWAVAIAMSVAVCTSAFVAVFFPHQGLMPARGTSPGGEWQGIYGNRNSLSPVCVLALLGLVGVVMIRRTLRTALWVSPIAVLALVALRESSGLTSTMALALVILVAAALPVVWRLRSVGAPGWAVGGGLAVASAGTSAYVFSHLGELATRVGRDPTLSHRTQIWHDVRQFIAVHPWRGYGYWAFWDRADLTAGTYARHGDAYSSAHNSVLEVVLGLGVIGLVFYIAIGLTAIAGIAAWTWRTGSLASWWWALVFAFLFAQNLMESFVLWHSYQWILFIAAAVVPFRADARADAEAR